jgi:tRNA(fMet)-specific endonuclease VapC
MGIGFADCMQVGICLRYGLPLATRNRKYFERVEGLQLVDVEAA